MKKIMTVFVFAAALASAERRVAVMDFDTTSNPMVQSKLAGTMQSGMQPGETLASLLRVALSKAPGLRMVDRGNIRRIMAEQNIGMSDRFDQKLLLPIGRNLQADAFVFGQVLDFSMEDQNKGVEGKYFLFGKQKVTTKIVVSAVLVSTVTGEVISAATGEGSEELKGGMNIKISGITSRTSRQEVHQTIAISAMQKAVASLADQLAAKARTVPEIQLLVVKNDTPKPEPKLPGNEKIPALVVPPQVPKPVAEVATLVSEVDGKQVVLTGGNLSAMKVGDRLNVRHSGSEVVNPATKEKHKIYKDVEIITVIEVQNGLIIASSLLPSKAVIGDIVVKAPATAVKPVVRPTQTAQLPRPVAKVQ